MSVGMNAREPPIASAHETGSAFQVGDERMDEKANNIPCLHQFFVFVLSWF
jgi:hypothetical protein